MSNATSSEYSPAQIWAARFSGLTMLALLLSGCAYRSQTTGMAMEYNEFVADTTNRQTVLNILRAKNREPMHFTSFSRVLGKVASGGEIGVNTNVNGNSSSLTNTTTGTERFDAAGKKLSNDLVGTVTALSSVGATNWTPSAKVQISTGTDFDIAINAGEEFYKGILGPISPSLVVNYLRQGYPADLVTYLFVGRFEYYAVVSDLNGVKTKILLRTVTNTPDRLESANEFSQAVRCRELSYVPDPVEAQKIPVNDLSDLSGIPLDVLARVRTDDVKSSPPYRYTFNSPPRTDFRIALSSPNSSQCGKIRDDLEADMRKWIIDQRIGNPPENDPTQPQIAPLNTALASRPDSNLKRSSTDRVAEGIDGSGGATFDSAGYFNKQLAPFARSGDLQIEMTIRSVEGILYYLGEYIRPEKPSILLDGPACISDQYCIPIIRISERRNFSSRDLFAEVRYRGVDYGIPVSGPSLNETSGRSSQVISLVQQLLNLNRSAKDLPTTPLVRVAN